MLIHEFLITLILFSCGRGRYTYIKAVDNLDLPLILSFSHPGFGKSNYDIRDWVKQLYLQQCVFVEIGENFCAIFVELRGTLHNSTHSNIFEFFLGICNCENLRAWILCPPEVQRERKSDCMFNEATPTANTSARVHRRLCDVTLLSLYAPPCDCTLHVAGEQLRKTQGFPTCFRNPLPQSICGPRGVCGVSMCYTMTIRGVHSVRCDPNCKHRQPFCEDPSPWTSKQLAVKSTWSAWSEPKCNVTCGTGVLISTSTCLNELTGKLATDCIGPGLFCCTADEKACSCKIVTKNKRMVMFRFTEPCFSTDSCNIEEKMRILGRDDMVAADEGDIFDFEESDRNYLDSISNGELFDYGGAPGPLQRRLSGRQAENMDNLEMDSKIEDDSDELSAAISEEDEDEDNDDNEQTPNDADAESIELSNLANDFTTEDDLDDDEELEEILSTSMSNRPKSKAIRSQGEYHHKPGQAIAPSSYDLRECDGDCDSLPSDYEDDEMFSSSASLVLFNYLLLSILPAAIGGLTSSA